MAKIEPVTSSESDNPQPQNVDDAPKAPVAASEDKPVVTSQPEAKEPPKVSALIPLSNLSTETPVKNDVHGLGNPPPAPRPPRRRVWIHRWRRFVQITGMILSGLWRVLFILGCGVGIIVAFALVVGIGVGISAANGTIFMLIGNAILKATNHSGYTGNPEAAAVGAVGGILAILCVGTFFENCVPKTEMGQEGPQHAWWLRGIATVLSGTVTGPVGCSIMRRHMDLKGLDVLHATRAGALGGTIMAVGAVFIGPILLLGIGLLLTPLWIAMAMGYEFIHAKTSESWGPNSHSYSACYCYGTCGDEEIEEEVQRIHDIERRHAAFNASSSRPIGFM